MDKNRYLQNIISDIFKINNKIRFVSVIDLNGNVFTSKMRSDLESLLKKSSEEKFCKHVAIRRNMRHEFDKKLGKVNFVHVERENISQFVVYSKSYSFFVTAEPEIKGVTKASITMKIKKIVSTLK